MSNVFPEIGNYRVGQKIEGCSKEPQNLVDQIDKFENNQQENLAKCYMHIKLTAFWLNGKYYEGFLYKLLKKHRYDE